MQHPSGYVVDFYDGQQTTTHPVSIHIDARPEVSIQGLQDRLWRWWKGWGTPEHPSPGAGTQGQQRCANVGVSNPAACAEAGRLYSKRICCRYTKSQFLLVCDRGGRGGLIYIYIYHHVYIHIYIHIHIYRFRQHRVWFANISFIFTSSCPILKEIMFLSGDLVSGLIGSRHVEPHPYQVLDN